MSWVWKSNKIYCTRTHLFFLRFVNNRLCVTLRYDIVTLICYKNSTEHGYN
jgi:hypothetical protein